MILNKDYRENPSLSNSAMKYFRENGPKLYFDKFIDPDRPPEPEKSTESTTIGDAVDTLLTDPQSFKDVFYVSADVKVTDDMKACVLLTREKAINIMTGGGMSYEKAIISPVVCDCREAKLLFVQAARELNFYNNIKDEEKLAEKLIAVGGPLYNDLSAAKGRVVLDQTTFNVASKTAASMLSNEHTGPILKREQTKDIEIQTQMMITVEINGFPCKILIDWVEFDKKNKIIYPFDIKSALCHSRFLKNYRDFYYGQQGSFYSTVLKAKYPDYKVAPFAFLVGPTESSEDPMIYEMTEKELLIQRDGCITKAGINITGWMDTLNRIKWHSDNGNWRYPKEYYERPRMSISSYAADQIEAMGDGYNNDDF